MALIKDAIVQYAVSDTTANNAWGTLAALIGVWQMENVSIDTVNASLKEAEQTFRDEFHEALPTAYRSAKSVCLKAYKENVPIVNDDGNAKGKSALEADIKMVRVMADAEAKPEVDPIAELDKALKMVLNVYLLCETAGLGENAKAMVDSVAKLIERS